MNAKVHPGSAPACSRAARFVSIRPSPRDIVTMWLGMGRSRRRSLPLPSLGSPSVPPLRELVSASGCRSKASAARVPSRSRASSSLRPTTTGAGSSGCAWCTSSPVMSRPRWSWSWELASSRKGVGTSSPPPAATAITTSSLARGFGSSCTTRRTTGSTSAPCPPRRSLTRPRPARIRAFRNASRWTTHSEASANAAHESPRAAADARRVRWDL